MFQRYFKEDPEFLWGSAPKPRLTNASFHKNFDYNVDNVWDQEEKDRKLINLEYQLTEEEPLWDGADAGRAGKDIFWNVTSAVLNKSGLDWVTRHYAAKGIRIHPIKFDFRPTLSLKPWHIDCEFTMVRPGLLITSPQSPVYSQEILELFRKNDWEIVVAADPSHEYNCDVSFCYVTRQGGIYGKKMISMNTFALGPNTICVEAHESAYMEQLNKMGIEVVPVPYDQVVPFGGSLHCTTLDIYRESEIGDYFPNQ